MRKVFVVLVLTLLSSGTFAGNLMNRFDLDSNKVVTMDELKQAGCTVREGLFNVADKNGDGSLSKKELRKAQAYLVVRKRCPKGEVS